MDYLFLKNKYEKKLERLKSNIKSFKESKNQELMIAVITLEHEKEEIELLLKAITKIME